MEIILRSVRNVFFSMIVLVINVPIFWSFKGFFGFIKDVIRYLGIST